MSQETDHVIHSGELYACDDPEILAKQRIYQDRLAEFNRLLPSQEAQRAAMLKEILGDCGRDVWIEAPFYANFGGQNCHFADCVYLNYACTFVDDTHIYVGRYTQFGPNVIVTTAAHPASPALRRKAVQYNLPVHIGEDCWIGAGAIILPGITIGDGSIIGAGSIVTKDVPPNVIAVGSPCRILREIDESDLETYDHGTRRIDRKKWGV